ncbi:MAG: DUF342 domain-containing protein [Desulfobacteraceae bacterium]|nr:DUF342 domain-containing protein [Desulfobacteraceae bacterium]
MTLDKRTDSPIQPTIIECQNALVTKIALFLNYLDKKNYQKLAQDMAETQLSSEGEILKLMISKRYIDSQDINGLKKACLSFARAQEDTRFGSLCIQFDFVTQSNLKLALEEQKALASSGRQLFLGDLLIEAGMLSERQQKLILQKQKLDKDFKETYNFQAAIPTDYLTTPDRQIYEVSVTISITNNAVKATMLKTDQFYNRLTLADLKQLIEENDIIYGVTDDESLNQFIANDIYKTKEFDLAKGLAPEDGIDAQIFYMFEQNHLKAGTITSDGSIDFKTRGDIPFTKTGNILAEKIPPKPGRDGVNIFGDVILAVQPVDVDLKYGKGVNLSENKLQALAQFDGYPKITQNEELIVNDAYIIKGDVDYTTGHIKFDKNIFITGDIKSGFKVEGVDVIANALDGGIVQAKGDVCIQNGVTNASITTKGNISAGFIHRSNIICMGDIDVRKEVVETDIALDGTFEMLRGKMYASSLTAKGGAKIGHIGSEKTRAVTITVGTSPYFKKELKILNQLIIKNQAIFERKKTKTDQNDVDQARISKKLALAKQVRQEYLDQFQKASKANPPPSKDLAPKTDLDKINQEIAVLHAQQNRIKQKIELLEEEIFFFSDAIKQALADKFDLEQYDQETPPKSILEVNNKIFAGTQVKGRHAKIIIQEDMGKARIMEMSCTNKKSSRKEWEMIITRL